MRPDIFSDENSFKHAFRQRLQDILHQADLGCFILVCANAFGDPELHRQLLPDIQRQFSYLQTAVKSGALDTGEITATDEDREIFLKIMQQGLDAIPIVQYRQAGDWRCQFNHLRTFRPTRMAANKITTLHQDYKAEGFNFNKAFIQKEQLWEGAWQGKQISWYYNKFPFAHHHGLLVPERETQQPQYLSEENHEYIWQLLDDCTDSFSGLGVGYNSLGAFASVNHLHFQWFIEPEGLPVMSQRWQHNGGSSEYPVPCYRYTNPQQAWQAIKAWHEESIPYNLIYSGSSVYAFPRCIQSLITHSDWTSGFSWIETAGEMVIQNATAFVALNAQDIENEMYKLKLPKGEL